MAKPSEGAGSDKAELKKYLRLAREKPVHMAFALGADGKAIVKLDKLKPPRTLEKGLKEEEGTKNHRFGTVLADPEDDKTAKFVVNKMVGGIARKLVVALKGTGFSKVSIVLEDGSSVEAAAGEDDEEEDADGAEASASVDDEADEGQSQAGGEDGEDADATMGTPVPAEPEAAPMSADAPDAAGLTGQLKDLIKQMMAVIGKDPTQKAGLIEMATDAQASLKRGDLDQAAAGIEILRDAIGAGGGGMAATPAPASAATAPAPADAAPVRPADTHAGKTHAKARVAWLATRAKMTSDIDALSKHFEGSFKGHGKASDLQAAFKTRIDSVLGGLDEALAHKLDEVQQAEDAATHAKIVEEAKQIMARYQSIVASDKTIEALDRNPFKPMALQKTLSTTLSALAKAL